MPQPDGFTNILIASECVDEAVMRSIGRGGRGGDEHRYFMLDVSLKHPATFISGIRAETPLHKPT